MNKIPNEKNIIIASNMKPTHIFDLWGTMIDMEKMGVADLEMFYEASKKLGLNNAQEIAKNYKLVLENKAGNLKRQYCIDFQDVLAKANVQRDYTQSFYDDWLISADNILTKGHGVVIFTTSADSYFREQIPDDLGKHIGKIYEGSKTAERFKKIYNAENQLKHKVVSHTEDGLDALKEARDSKIFKPEGLIYINRDNKNSKKTVQEAGIQNYVNDLRDVDYHKIQ